MISWYKEEKKKSKFTKKNSKHLNCYFWISEMNKESMCVLLHLHKNGMIERSQSQKRKGPIIFSERNPHFIYSEGSWRIKKVFQIALSIIENFFLFWYQWLRNNYNHEYNKSPTIFYHNFFVIFQNVFMIMIGN